MASLTRLGNVGVSGLLKSAATLQNELNTYQDTIQRIAFENNPSDDQLQQYLTYLNGRVSTLQSTGSITNLTKAADLQQTMRTAIQTNTSFNIQNESIQVLAGNATDQQKLDYIGQAYQRAQSIGDVKLAQSLESQAYNLQQSIAYHAQAQATAAQVQFNAEQAAIKQGYTNAVDAIDSAWKDVVTAFKDGGAGDVQQALTSFTKSQAKVFQQLGVQLPAGAQLTMAGVAQAVMSAKYAYYENGAAALGNTPDAQAFQQKAQDIVTGVDTLATPAGTMNYQEITKWAQAPTNLYSAMTNEQGQNTLRENNVTGYQVIKGQVIPTTNGSVTATYNTLSSDQQNALKQQLQKLGFTPAGSDTGGWTSNGKIMVQLTDKTAKWIGGQAPDLQAGDIVTLIPAHGGFQLLSKSNTLYGLSFDSRGLAGLYRADTNGNYSLVGGQYGFNPQANKPPATTGVQPSAFVPGPAAGAVAQPARGFPSALPQPRMTQRVGGGFNFTNAQGQSISAATYAQLTNTPFRTLLQQMAGRGDQGAATALNFVGNDFGYDPTKSISYQNSGLYNALTWGTGVKAMPSAAPASLLGNGAQLKF